MTATVWENQQGNSRRFDQERLDFACALWHALKVETTGEGDSADSFGSGNDEETVAALDRLSRHAFENGLYDRNVMPEGGTDE